MFAASVVETSGCSSDPSGTLHAFLSHGAYSHVIWGVHMFGITCYEYKFGWPCSGVETTSSGDAQHGDDADGVDFRLRHEDR